MASPTIAQPPVKGMPPRRRFMADGNTTPPPLYNPISYPQTTNPIGYNSSSDPVAATVNQRQWTAGAGDALQSNDENLAQQYAAQSQGTQNYLNPIEQGFASGQGGYNPTETSQVELTPEQQQNMVTGAGISAGAQTASGVGAAERSAAAAGGSPAALAAYRARAAQTGGAQAGDAMTQARIGAQQAGSAGAQAVGNARMNQQQQGTQYLGNLQSQQSTASQNEQGLGQGAYGTQTNATGAATGQQVAATTLPTIADKLIGAGAGALGGILADGKKGTADYFADDDGMDAVVGEAGPEVIVEATPHMADGGSLDPSTNIPLLKAISGGMAGYTQRGQPGAAVPAWNKATPWMQAGTAAGKLVKHFMSPKPVASPYKNTAADSTGTYTMPGGAPTPINAAPASGVGDDEMQGTASYMANGGFAGDLANGIDDDGSGGDTKKNPDGSPKAGTPKVTNPEQSIRNYLSGAMANALRPPTPDQQYSLAWGAPKVPTAGKPGTTPKTPATPPTFTANPKMGPVLTNWPPPANPSTPPANPLPVKTSWPPPVTGGGTGTPRIPVRTSWPPPSPPQDPSLNPTLPDIPPPPPLVEDVNSTLRGPSFIPPTARQPRQPVIATPPETPTGSDSTITFGGPSVEPYTQLPVPELPDPNVPDPNVPATPTGPGLNPQVPDLPETPIPPPPPAGGTGVDSTINYAGGVPDQSNLQPVGLPPDSGVDPFTPPDLSNLLPPWSPPPSGGETNLGLPPDSGVDPTSWLPPDPTGGMLPDDPFYGSGAFGGGGGGYDGSDDWNDADWGADGLIAGRRRTPHMADGGMRPAFRWSERQPHQNRAPAGGYTPMNFRAKPPMMADGTKIVTSPTRVKLAPGDQVVPLSYRPKAKVRPSAAVPSLFRARPGVSA